MVNEMTDVHEIVQRVEASPEFQEFSNANPHHYLAHVFATSAAEPGPMELGYYSKESDMITVFKTAPIAAMPPEEVFKESGTLRRLDLDAVLLGLAAAMERAEKERASAYPRHPAMKMICILQQQDVPVWNITIVTGTLQMINMKLSATNGELLSRSMQSIMGLVRE